MKTSTLKFATVTLTVVLLLASGVDKVYGQAAKNDDPDCPGIVTFPVTGEGYSRTAAIAALNANINIYTSTICGYFACPLEPPFCTLNSVSLAGTKPVCTAIADASRVNGRRWRYTRDVTFDCQCFVNAINKTGETNSLPSGDVKNFSQPGGLEIFPNPASQQVSLKVSGYEGNVQLRVVNIVGQAVIEKTIELQGQELYSIDISALPTGIYKVSLGNSSVFGTGTFKKE